MANRNTIGFSKLLIVFYCTLHLSFDNIAQSSLEEEYDKYYALANAQLNRYEFDSALLNAKEATEYAFELEDIRKIANCHWTSGYINYVQGNLVDAFSYYMGAKKAFIRLKDMKSLVLIEENLGTIALDNGTYGLAKSLYGDRFRTAEKLDNYALSHAYFDLGLAYEKEGELDTAAHFFYESLAGFTREFNEGNGDVLEMISRSYNEIGTIYYQLARTSRNFDLLDSARNNYGQALEMSDKLTDQLFYELNMGLSFLLEDNLVVAEEHLNDAIELSKLSDSNRLISRVLNALGKLHYFKWNLELAKQYFEKSIEINTGFDDPSMNMDDSDIFIEMNSNLSLLVAYQYLDTIQKKDSNILSSISSEKMLERYTTIVHTSRILDQEKKAELIELSYVAYRAEVERTRLNNLWIDTVKSIGLAILGFLLLIFGLQRVLRIRFKAKKRLELEKDIRKIVSREPE